MMELLEAKEDMVSKDKFEKPGRGFQLSIIRYKSDLYNRLLRIGFSHHLTVSTGQLETNAILPM